ncbi:hypothetical protein HML84_07425 [Alcanivorax sp. IO_7]|nr:hypothetical protein HML84_07425 [Alcanivorax sp. IO_7]
MLSVMVLDQHLEPLEHGQVLVARRLRRQGAARQPEQADEDQPRQAAYRQRSAGTVAGGLVAERLEQPFQPVQLGVPARLQLRAGHAQRPHLGRVGEIAALLQQAPHQLLTHGEHMAVGVRLGDEGMGHGGRREKEQGAVLVVLALVQVDAHQATLHEMHLEKRSWRWAGMLRPKKSAIGPRAS